MTTEVEDMRDGGHGRQGNQADITADNHGGGDVGQQGQQQ